MTPWRFLALVMMRRLPQPPQNTPARAGAMGRRGGVIPHTQPPPAEEISPQSNSPNLGDFSRKRAKATILVGRDAELAAALHRLRESAGDSGRACFWIGEPGTGKSRLLTELATRAVGEGLLVVRGRASGSGSSPLRPFAEALAGLDRR